jgi:hypothetical protein
MGLRRPLALSQGLNRTLSFDNEDDVRHADFIVRIVDLAIRLELV